MFDLRATQLWRERGISRYIQNLVFSIQLARPGVECCFLYDRNFEYALWHEALADLGTFYFDSDDLSDISVDALVFGCAVVPNPVNQSLAEYLLPRGFSRARVKLLAAIIYDFIPWRFPDVYLRTTIARKWYLEALDFMQHLDLLFTTSSEVKRDTAKLFPAHEAHGRIININGGIGTFKGFLPNHHALAEATLKKYHLVAGGYWIYIGGDGPCKNLKGLVEAVRFERHGNQLPLVIAGNFTKEQINDLLAPLPKDCAAQIQFTGFIADDELWALLANGFGTVFVSKYEELGLAVLEAYECGVPVLCANNSSLRHLAPRPCLIGDASPEAIAAKMRWAENNPSRFKTASLTHWQTIKQDYSWPFAAHKVLEALDSFLGREPEAKTTPQRDRLTTKVIWYSILPPAQSGIADFNDHIFRETPKTSDQPMFAVTNMAAIKVDKIPYSILHPNDDDLIEPNPDCARVFTFGNSPHHLDTLKFFLTEAGRASTPPLKNYIYIHETMLHGMWLSYFSSYGEYKKFLKFFYPEASLLLDSAMTLEAISALRIFGVRPLTKLGKVERILVNSDMASELLRHDLGLAGPEISKIFHPIYRVNLPPKLTTNDSHLRIGCFGIANNHKSPEKVIAACRILRAGGLKVELIFAGYRLDVLRSAVNKEDRDWIELNEGLDEPALLKAMASVDLAVQLRDMTHGEASGIVCQLLGLKTPIVVTRMGWFEELGDAVYYVAPDATPMQVAGKIHDLLNADKHLVFESMQHLQSRWSVENFWKAIAQSQQQ